MPVLRIDVATVEALADRVKAERDGTVTDLLGRLRAINAELDSAWDGPAKAQFQATYGDWITQLERHSKTLNNVHQYLTRVAQNFRELDEAARQAAAGAATVA